MGATQKSRAAEGPAPNEDRGPRRACRVDGEVRDRDANEVNQGQPETNRDGREAGGRTLVGRAQDIIRKANVRTTSAIRQATSE